MKFEHTHTDACMQMYVHVHMQSEFCTDFPSYIRVVGAHGLFDFYW